MNKKIAVTWLSLAMLFSFIVIIVEIVPRVEAPAILEVDDSGGKPYTSIQAAVDDAQPGDTVYVYNGTYYEDVVINKTINLTGEDKDNTKINTSSIGIFVKNADYVNITGFTVENASIYGIEFECTNNSFIGDNKLQENDMAINLFNSIDSEIINNYITDNNNAIYLSESNYNNIEGNWVLNNGGNGIEIRSYSDNNSIVNNTCSNNKHGIIVRLWSDNNEIINNEIKSNSGIGIYIVISNNNTFLNNTCLNNSIGAYLNYYSSDLNRLVNCTIQNSSEYDINLTFESKGFIINTTFNKSKVHYFSTTSTLIVQWYLHVFITDCLGNPVPNAKVKIEENKNGSYQEIFTTDGNGYLRWLTVTEYIEQDTNGDEIGEKTYYTPHKIVAWNETLVGYAQPFMNKSKTVTIVLFNGTLIDLELGWNLISLPRIQSNTDIETILQSIDGRYNSVWQYNITDTNDQWKLYHISKPSFMNDLWELNHTMGFWLYVTDPGGTILVVFGDILTSDQYISLHPGWNLVGYPSTTNKTRDIALNNTFFNTEIDSIWTFNSTSQKWVELGDPMDYFEVGKGYWIHSKVTKTWVVPH